MYIYKISRTDTIDYDDYDSMIVIAESKEKAVAMHPDMYTRRRIASSYMEDDDYNMWVAGNEDVDDNWYCGEGRWVKYKDINTLEVDMIGLATNGRKEGIVITSFNAG